MTALLATWRARVALALTLPLGLALWSNTLSDHLGYVSALAAALYASVVGGIVGARPHPPSPPLPKGRGGSQSDGSQSDGITGDGATSPPPRTAVTPSPFRERGLGGEVEALVFPLLLVALIALVVLAHGLVAPACSPSQGALWWLLIPLPGAALAGVSGLALRTLLPRGRAATVLATLLVPAFIVWSLARFYVTPTIFAYDPFYGFFPGAIYDETLPLGLPLVTYRLGTLGAIIALTAALRAFRSPSGTFSFAQGRQRPQALALALVGASLAAGIWWAGPSLGHRHTADDIARALEGETWSRRCVVRHDRSIHTRLARLTARDCDVRIAQLEDFYGVHVRRRVTVFLFANAEQKQSLMGAADTYIAKPWRYEVYLQQAPFPHPVLKHELAHVAAAEMAPGPLHITARGWLLPVPGLVEGAAVAAAWEGEGEATPHQWSRAMLEAGIAPRVATLTGLGFFASASVTAYTAAGSFCRWLHATYGAEKFRRLYATADFEGAYGVPLRVLERRWHAWLRRVPVSDRTLARARTRFRRASIFGRHCPYELEDLADEAARHLAAGNLPSAERELRVLVERDPTDPRTRVMLAVARVRAGDLPGADRVAAEATEALGEAAGNRVRTSIGDAVWRWQTPADAEARYARVDVSLLDEDDARTLQLKRAMLARGGEYEAAVRDLLIGRGELDPSPITAMARLAALRVQENDPRAVYLVGRQLFMQERYADALAVLDEAAIARADDARVLAEARRMIAVARYHTGDLVGATEAFRRLAEDETRPQGLRDAARDQLDRIRRER